MGNANPGRLIGVAVVAIFIGSSAAFSEEQPASTPVLTLEPNYLGDVPSQTTAKPNEPATDVASLRADCDVGHQLASSERHSRDSHHKSATVHD